MKNGVSQTASVRSRVESAIAYLVQETTGPLSVAKVCSVAGVNRGNLYVCHPDLVHAILAKRARSPLRSPERVASATKAELRQQLRQLSLENKALLYLLLEKRLSLDNHST